MIVRMLLDSCWGSLWFGFTEAAADGARAATMVLAISLQPTTRQRFGVLLLDVWTWNKWKAVCRLDLCSAGPLTAVLRAMFFKAVHS